MLLAPLVAGLVSGLTSPEAGVRLRCAVGLERVTRAHPELLAPHKKALLGPVAASPSPEVQWHLAQLVPRLELDDPERAEALALVLGMCNQRASGIVEANALEAVVELAHGHPEHERVAARCLQRALADSSATVRTRAWRLFDHVDDDRLKGTGHGHELREPRLS